VAATINLTLLVAIDEDGEPLVCGAWETNLLDIIDADEVDALFAKARTQWLPDYAGWREVRVNVDRDAIIRAFQSPTITAEVES
jgi:hypothetical protein